MNMNATSRIKVQVETKYLAEHSDPSQKRYVFAYTVEIMNTGSEPAKLVGRHWIITDGHGRKQVAVGEGVIGRQPSIPPGKNYRYTSGAVLNTPIGTMHGYYRMLTTGGKCFDADIEPFLLAQPHMLH